MSAAQPLPTVPFGGAEVSRLIIGGNPLRGNSHVSPAMDEEMLRWFTVARIKETLAAAEACGINTVQARGDALVLQVMREYWDEGGRLQFIVQTASELRDLAGHVRHLAGFGALGIYLHGTWVDRQFQEGNPGAVRDLLAAARDTGVRTGLGAHMPEVIDHAEEEGWDVDFYMTCLYNLSRQKRESALVSGMHQQEVFDHNDKWAMLERVRATGKTCLVFKILGASRLAQSPEQTREAFAAVFQHMKPHDAVVVGMSTQHHDQIAENCEIVRALCREGAGE